MSELTRASMHDARDAEDTRLLEAGEYGALVESYYRVMLDGSRISKISALGGLRGAGARRGRAFPVELLDHSAEVLSFGRGQWQPFDRRELEGALIWSHLCGWLLDLLAWRHQRESGGVFGFALGAHLLDPPVDPPVARVLRSELCFELCDAIPNHAVECFRANFVRFALLRGPTDPLPLLHHRPHSQCNAGSCPPSLGFPRASSRRG